MTDPLSLRKDRIYLTGFMGSGKSTIGPILANTIGYDFLDIDRTIEAEEQKTVNEIFRENGEQYFRTLERSIVAKINTRPRLVISLGGGTLTDPETLRAIISNGILVYLKVTPEQLFKRLQRKTDRPLLSDIEGNRLSEPDLRQRIASLYAAREPIYAKADITIMTDDVRVGLTVDQIVKRLSRYLR
jgi:shikimate kinase